jgi:catechol 2,3-dioxygenase-like lactoylglutathione lyase family enzyme
LSGVRARLLTGGWQQGTGTMHPAGAAAPGAATTTHPHPQENTVQFGYTIVYVSDVPASIDFYERAFGLQRGFVSPEGDFGTLATGTTALGFCRHGLARESLGQGYVAADASPQPLGIEIALVTPDVAAACQQAVAAGATLLQPPADKPWGQTVAYLRCPDGSLVELCTPMG